MKTSLVACYLIGLSVLFLLAAFRAARTGRAWVPFSSNLEAGLQIRRDTRPTVFWALTGAYAVIGFGSVAALVRVLLSKGAA